MEALACTALVLILSFGQDALADGAGRGRAQEAILVAHRTQGAGGGGRSHMHDTLQPGQARSQFCAYCGALGTR